MTSSAYTYITPSGVVVPDTSATLATVQGWWTQAFGADLVTDPSTPQGVIIATEALALNAVINNNAALANQINPNIAGGIFLDAIMALTGTARNAQTPTTVTNCTITGVAGTVLPVGAQAQTAAGDVFQLTTQTTIPSGGTITGTFQSMAYGPIPCADGALNEIVSSILGWETITNNQEGSPASATTLGTTTQSDQAARAFRNNTLAFQGLSLAEAITSALYAVPGVTSLSFRENFNDVPMGALVSVTGGATLAGTIWGMTTTTGSGTNGAVVIGTDALLFAKSLQNLPAINPWPVAAFSTTGNVTLSGLGTQSGGDWTSTLTAGQTILVKNQTTTTQNGLYACASGSWTQLTGYATGTVILGSNGGISMIPNSVYACVNGGLSTAVAAALLENKSSGCGWNGNTVVNLIEPASGQSYPVQYDTPAGVGILVQATVSGVSAQNASQAILDYAAGNIEGFNGFVVGAPVSPFELAGAIMAENPGSYVSNIQVGIAPSGSLGTNPIPIGLNEIANTQLSYITIIVS
jgi:hypothetical protein